MTNIAASIRAKLLNMAKKEHIPFQRILTLYKQEGILHRIMMTRYNKDIVLKGGLLLYQSEPEAVEYSCSQLCSQFTMQ